MSWPLARDTVATIIEETTGLLQKGGAPRTFHHYEEAKLEDGVDTRAFWLEIKKMGMRGLISSSPPRWLRYEIDVVTVYRVMTDVTLLHELIALDHLARATRYLDQRLWNQPTSTIESLFLGDDVIAHADIEEVDGALVVRDHLFIDFRP